MVRAPLVALLVTLLLMVGCGTPDTASDTATTGPSPSTSPTKGGVPVDFDLVALLSQTAAGGRVSPDAVRLDDEAAVEAFAAQFKHEAFGDKIAQTLAATTVPEGRVLLGAVVYLGCDVPPGVLVTGEPGSWQIVAQKVPTPMQECFAPVTTVALVTVAAP